MAYGILTRSAKLKAKAKPKKAAPPPAIPEFIRRMCTEKQRFTTEGDALAILSVMVGRKGGRPGRVYRCEHCDGFHITSRLIPTNPQNAGVGGFAAPHKEG